MMKFSRSQSNIVWIQFSSIILVLLLSYWETVQFLIRQWLNNDDFSHGLLIIPISAYLAWERRKSVNIDQIKPDWRALSVLLVSVCIYIAGQLGAELFVKRFSMLLFFTGAIWLLFGMQLVRTLMFPLLFLFMMLPLPGVVYRNLTFPLQILSSKWAVTFLNFAGVLAYREGNVIDLGFTRLQVVEACNGLRFILPLLTLGILFAFWKPKPIWKRLILISSTIPIAITANILRIGGTGILSKYWGVEAAQGFFHGFSGWVVFMISFGIFFCLNWLLGLLSNPKKFCVKPVEQGNGNLTAVRGNDEPNSRLSMNAPIVVFVSLIISAPLLTGWLENISPKGLKQPLRNFPLIIEDRVGQRQSMEEEIWKKVGGHDYFMAEYVREGEAPVDFYVAFYEHQSKEGSYVHSPKYCLPGAGWFINSKNTRMITATGRDSLEQRLPVSELIIRKGAYSQLVYFWYQGRDRFIQTEWAAKFWTVWDGIWKRRTDGALVRIVSPISNDENLRDKRQKMDQFAILAAGLLDQEFLP